MRCRATPVATASVTWMTSGASAIRDRAVNADCLASGPVPREVRSALATRRAEVAPEGIVGCDSIDGICPRIHVGRADEHAALTDDLRQRTRLRGDHGHAGGHRLQRR